MRAINHLQNKNRERWLNKKRSINLLISKSSWLYKSRDILKKKLKRKGNTVKLIFNHEKLAKADLSFILSYYKIIPNVYLKKSKMNLVIHESNLPKGRGFAPLSWQILKGYKKIIFSLFNIDNLSHKPDTGNIILKSKVIFKGNELIDEIRNIALKTYCKMIDSFFRCPINFRGYRQKGQSSSFKKRRPKDSILKINKTINENFNLLRVVDNTNYPAYFKKGNKEFIIKIFPKLNEKN